MELVTERLRLRDFERDDWRAMFAIESDPIAVRYQSYEPRTEDGCREYIERDFASRLPDREERSCFDLAVTLKTDGRFVGRLGLNILRPERRVAALWFILDRALWGQGLMPEGARALVDFGFREKGLGRVYLECDPRNTGAIGLAKKLGMVREGQLREHDFVKGEWCDSLYFGVLAREWRGT
jgi:[ribosomal protein S5]-alanine N-acetyltransferase